MLQPLEYQKQLCATSQGTALPSAVASMQVHPKVSAGLPYERFVPNAPCRQGGRLRSTAFRDGGMTSELCAAAGAGSSSAATRAPSSRRVSISPLLALVSLCPPPWARAARL